MRPNDLQWRLDSIYAEIDNLVMFAAAWPSMNEEQRNDVHQRWNGLVCRQVSDIRWSWRKHARGEREPEWWGRLQDAFDEHQRLIDYMDLQRPEVDDIPSRWVLRWVRE